MEELPKCFPFTPQRLPRSVQKINSTSLHATSMFLQSGEAGQPPARTWKANVTKELSSALQVLQKREAFLDSMKAEYRSIVDRETGDAARGSAAGAGAAGDLDESSFLDNLFGGDNDDDLLLDGGGGGAAPAPPSVRVSAQRPPKQKKGGARGAAKPESKEGQAGGAAGSGQKAGDRKRKATPRAGSREKRAKAAPSVHFAVRVKCASSAELWWRQMTAELPVDAKAALDAVAGAGGGAAKDRRGGRGRAAAEPRGRSKRGGRSAPSRGFTTIALLGFPPEVALSAEQQKLQQIEEELLSLPPRSVNLWRYVTDAGWLPKTHAETSPRVAVEKLCLLSEELVEDAYATAPAHLTRPVKRPEDLCRRLLSTLRPLARGQRRLELREEALVGAGDAEGLPLLARGMSYREQHEALRRLLGRRYFSLEEEDSVSYEVRMRNGKVVAPRAVNDTAPARAGGSSESVVKTERTVKVEDPGCVAGERKAGDAPAAPAREGAGADDGEEKQIARPRSFGKGKVLSILASQVRESGQKVEIPPALELETELEAKAAEMDVGSEGPKDGSDAGPMATERECERDAEGETEAPGEEEVALVVPRGRDALRALPRATARLACVSAEHNRTVGELLRRIDQAHRSADKGQVQREKKLIETYKKVEAAEQAKEAKERRARSASPTPAAAGRGNGGAAGNVKAAPTTKKAGSGGSGGIALPW